MGRAQRRRSRGHSRTAAPILAHVHSAPARTVGPVRDAGERADRFGAAGQQCAVLLEAARMGNESAWSELVTRCTAALSRTARSYRLNESDVADVVQLTWLRLVENLDRIRQPQALNAWLITTCRREAMRAVRANSRTDPHDPGDPLGGLARLASQDAWSDPVYVVLRKEASAVVRLAVEKLPQRQERLLNKLMSTHGETAGSYLHVAAALHIPVGSVGPTRQRALQRLRADETLLAFQTA
ncbi:MAG: RNA polymerase sigma factor [Mycobacteriales bacterium]